MDSKKKIAGDYDEVSAMGNGVAAVKSGNKWSLIDTKGKKVTKDKYDSVVLLNYQPWEGPRGAQGYASIKGVCDRSSSEF